MVQHDASLPPAVSGDRQTIAASCGPLSFYRAAPERAATEGEPPLLLIHSINAAGSAYEMRPLYEHYRQTRMVYAPDLPGFGFSDRSDRAYTPRLITDAILDMVAHIRRTHGEAPIDAVALSLSSEFLARAAAERPGWFRSLAMVSPTGFDKKAPYRESAGTTRRNPTFYSVLRFRLWDRGFFKVLTSRRGIRYFLERTWGSKTIDEGLLDYDYLTTHQPGARFAPYYFVSGYLFSRDITKVYESLTPPVWLSHGVRGDFQDYSYAKEIVKRPNWTVTEFQTGALPHFEQPDNFIQHYDQFIGRVNSPRPKT